MLDSNLDIDGFVRQFPNEEELRRAIAQLLLQIPDVRDVQVLHGAQEKGKDIVFYAPSGLTGKLLFACVIKNERITGSVSSGFSARNLLFQIEQCLDTDHVSLSGFPEKVARVYVVCPHELAMPTIESICGKLRDRAYQVEFLCGYRLLSMFLQYLPNQLKIGSHYVASHLSQFRAQINKDDPLLRLCARHGILLTVSTSLEKVYVRPNFVIPIFYFTADATLAKTFVFDASAPCRGNDIVRLERFARSIGSLSVLHEYFDTGLNPRELATFSDKWPKSAAVVRRAFNREYKASLKHSHDAASSGDSPNRRTKSQKRTEIKVLLSLSEEERGDLDHLIYKSNGITNALVALLQETNDQIRSSGMTVKDILSSGAFKRHEAIASLVDDKHLESVFLTKSNRDEDIHLTDETIYSIGRFVFIVAPAGFGKTSFCRWNTINDLAAFGKGTSSRIPIYVPLHKFATGFLGSFEDAFLLSNELYRFTKTPEANPGAMRHFEYCVYLDGLDEIPSNSRRKEIMALIKSAVDDDPSLHLFVTARDYVYGPWISWMPRVRLSPLDDGQIEELSLKWFDGDQTKSSEFLERVSMESGMKGIMAVPLLASLILAFYRKFEILPASITQLYELVVDLYCGGWDFVKGIRRESSYAGRDKTQILTRFAGMLHAFGRKHGSDNELINAIAATSPELVPEGQPVIEALAADSLLVKAGERYMFSHLSFQEYLCARDLFDPSGERPTRALGEFLQGNEWWREVLKFYVRLNPHPEEVRDWIREVASTMTDSREIDATTYSRMQVLLVATKTNF